MSDVTRILSQIERGEPQAAEKLLPLVYEELRKLAAAKLALEKPGQTLVATALVHEAYIRLIGGREKSEIRDQRSEKKEPRTEGPKDLEEAGDGEQGTGDRGQSWDSRGHFFAAAAEAMRRILVDASRRKQSQRHGGGTAREEFLEVADFHIPIGDQLLDLDESLAKLAATEPQCAELVKLRIFAGMTVEEAALVQGISSRTAKRNWAYARAWLGRQLAAYDPAST